MKALRDIIPLGSSFESFFIRLSTNSLTLATDILGFIPQFEARPLAEFPAVGLFSYIIGPPQCGNANKNFEKKGFESS
ncbi:MAG: hypothetical protein IJF40_06425 [Clostridia bacterium]|nr:hypothetical protein [Clostridia bacterium]